MNRTEKLRKKMTKKTKKNQIIKKYIGLITTVVINLKIHIINEVEDKKDMMFQKR